MSEDGVPEQAGGMAGQEKADLFGADALRAVPVDLAVGLHPGPRAGGCGTRVGVDEERAAGRLAREFSEHGRILLELGRMFIVESEIDERGPRNPVMIGVRASCKERLQRLFDARDFHLFAEEFKGGGGWEGRGGRHRSEE